MDDKFKFKVDCLIRNSDGKKFACIIDIIRFLGECEKTSCRTATPEAKEVLHAIRMCFVDLL